MPTVMVFGVFDGLHEGHRAFLREAREHGDRTIAVVTPDDVVRELKHKTPRFDFDTRAAAILAEGLADEAVEGDAEPGTWEVVRRHRPDVIALGYDQEKLGEALRDAGFVIEILTMGPHEPETYKSSLLNRAS